MNLSSDQIEAVKQGASVSISDEDLSIEQVSLLVERIMQEDDVNDPLFDTYQNVDRG